MAPSEQSHEKPSDARIAQLEADVATLAAAVKALAEANGIVWGDIQPNGWKW